MLIPGTTEQKDGSYDILNATESSDSHPDPPPKQVYGPAEPEEQKSLIFDEINAPQSEPQKRQKSEPINLGDLHSVGRLGGGHFGLTFKAKWKEEVVVIKASKDGTTRDDLEELGTYLKLPSCPNVLSLIGVCQSFTFGKVKVPTLAIIVPLQENGDLKAFVRKRGPFSDVEHINIVLGMARGLAHLHDNDMIHRDIALRNYLVSLYGRIVIADFGLSRRLEGQNSDDMYYRFTDASFPWRTASPEVLQTKKCTRESDIWAFGVAIWELYHPLMPPFSNKKDVLALLTFFLTDKEFSFTLDHGDQGDGDRNVKREYPSILETVVKRCCHRDSSKRPSIHDVIKMLLTGDSPDILNEDQIEVIQKQIQERAAAFDYEACVELHKLLEKLQNPAGSEYFKQNISAPRRKGPNSAPPESRPGSNRQQITPRGRGREGAYARFTGEVLRAPDVVHRRTEDHSDNLTVGESVALPDNLDVEKFDCFVGNIPKSEIKNKLMAYHGAGCYLLRACRDPREIINGQPNPDVFVLSYLQADLHLKHLKIYRTWKGFQTRSRGFGTIPTVDEFIRKYVKEAHVPFSKKLHGL